jgi:hypothetical protein
MVHDASIPSYKRLNCHFVCTKAHVTTDQGAIGYLPLVCDFGWNCVNPECCRSHYGVDGSDVKICPTLFRSNECGDDECEYAHPKQFHKASKPPPKIRNRKKPQEVADDEFEAMATQDVVKPIATTDKKEVVKKAGGRFAALDDSPEDDESTPDNIETAETAEIAEAQRFAMTTPVNTPVVIPEVVAAPKIVLTKDNYRTMCPLFASLTWEQAEAIAKQVGATNVEEPVASEPIRVVKPTAIDNEFPSLGSTSVKKQSIGKWGVLDAVKRNAKWQKIAKEKAAREAEEKKEAEEKARRTKEALLAKAKAEREAEALYAANLLDSDDEEDVEVPEKKTLGTEGWWN